MDNVHRVFFHELGHFVARQLNFLYYGGPEIVEIQIFPSANHLGDFCGHLEVKRPKDFISGSPVPIERLPSYLLSCIYGCMFQSYFQQSRMTDCFRIYGKDDNENFLGALLKHEIVEHDKFEKCRLDIFDKLVRNRWLDMFMKIELEKYLKATADGKFDVNIEELIADTQSLLTEHFALYQEFEDMISNVIKVYR